MKAMTPRILMIVALALLAMPLMAQAGEKKIAPAQAAAHLEPACRIKGRIAEVTTVAASPVDGTPSTLAVSETHVTVALAARLPRDQNTPDSDCALPEKGNAVYKLCSPAAIQKGDVITALEGLATGKNGYRCLFDVTSPTTAPPAPAVPPAGH